jgi:hypothetical protein
MGGSCGGPPRGAPRRGRELPQLPGYLVLLARRRLRLPRKAPAVRSFVLRCDLTGCGVLILSDGVVLVAVLRVSSSGREEVHGDGGGLLLRLRDGGRH